MNDPEWRARRHVAETATRALVDALGDDRPVDSALLTVYFAARTALAKFFEEYASATYGDPRPLESWRSVVDGQVRARFPFLEGVFQGVRTFGPVHYRVYNYLSAQPGVPVPGYELRFLTADAVHTERRARELRDLGFELGTTTVGGARGYVLQSPRPNLALGAWLQGRQAVLSLPLASAGLRDELLWRLGERPVDR